MNKVIVLQDDNLKKIQSISAENNQKLHDSISLAEQTLLSIGRGKEVLSEKNRIKHMPAEKKMIVVRNWEEVLEEAEKLIPYDVSIKDVFLMIN